MLHPLNLRKSVFVRFFTWGKRVQCTPVELNELSSRIKHFGMRWRRRRRTIRMSKSVQSNKFESIWFDFRVQNHVTQIQWWIRVESNRHIKSFDKIIIGIMMIEKSYGRISLCMSISSNVWRVYGQRQLENRIVLCRFILYIIMIYIVLYRETCVSSSTLILYIYIIIVYWYYYNIIIIYENMCNVLYAT